MDNNSGSVNDDELNKMIANLGGAQTATAPAIPNETVIQPPVAAVPAQNIVAEAAAAEASVSAPVPVATAAPTPVAADVFTPPAQNVPTDSVQTAATDENAENLDGIKGQALTELRPLVDKLDLAPEDKFDILLLMIRSTDDKTLIPEAHDVAKSISDESRKAQALLDIIKEIDFFSQAK